MTDHQKAIMDLHFANWDKENDKYRDWDSFHDVIAELITLKMYDNVEITKDLLKKEFVSLSEYTKNIAYQWGLSDTVFRDEAYVEIRDREKS